MEYPQESNPVTQQVRDDIAFNSKRASENLLWLKNQMHPLFFILNRSEVKALSMLIASLHHMQYHSRMLLKDAPNLTMIAQLGTNGSLYRTLQQMPDNDISYAELTTSKSKLTDTPNKLEVLRFDYQRKYDHEILMQLENDSSEVDENVLNGVFEETQRFNSGLDKQQLRTLLILLSCNNPEYVKVSSAARIARLLNLYAESENNDGMYLDLQTINDSHEKRILFAMASPPARGFLLQLLEVFNRLEISVNRSYSLTISNGVHPYFLSTFYITPRDNSELFKDGELYQALQREIYNTQILSSYSSSHTVFVKSGVTSGPDASLIDAMIGFCYTNLAHNHPDSFSVEGIKLAFHNHPEIATQLIAFFHARFNPDMKNREKQVTETKESVIASVKDFNTGRKFLDQFRRKVYHCAVAFIQNTLKTNFFIAEKHALAFRLDPAYLDELGDSFTTDLPAQRPFRITYFYARNGSGYHIGFSDIARGGWRTIITQGRDDFITNASTLFRENYVLAHTQHLKNKDIYEGGSKMVTILLGDEMGDQKTIQQQLYKLQFSFINAFFDLFVVEKGQARDVRVIDYYGHDEPIELGPDENMHDVMIERIARQSVKRGYILGPGIMSSKKVGINHKEYGVTSIGVIRFAEVTMQSIGIDMHNDRFSVKLTGGPNGDVAGNGLKLLLDRCSAVEIKLIIDGSGALYDPQGLDHKSLKKIILHSDVDEFDVACLHNDGFLLYRQQTKKEGMRVLYRKVTMKKGALEEEWLSTDAFYKTYNNLLFNVETDLFIPAGGRPETITIDNVGQFFNTKSRPTARAIVEGANSFITPEARRELQLNGVIIMRDASANKCGVISSSYEIIANLLLSDEEFLSNKDEYVSDVIAILNEMAEKEARLILKRYEESGGALLYSDVSDQISHEINDHYAKIFEHFQENPELCDQSAYLNAIRLHMPHIIGANPDFRSRIKDLPEKVKYAILASKLASALVYEADNSNLYAAMINNQVSQLPEFS